MTLGQLVKQIECIDYPEGKIVFRFAYDNILNLDDKKGHIQSIVDEANCTEYTFKEMNAFNDDTRLVKGFSILVEEGVFYFDIRIIIPFETYEALWKNDECFEDIKEDYFTEVNRILELYQ